MLSAKHAFAAVGLCMVVCLGFGQPAAAQVNGAIWTSYPDGTVVDANIYEDKDLVYLNGGPGKGSGSNSPGLSPDGVYIFMVTDPSGKALLSTDQAQCREVEVAGGVIAGATGPCPHAEGASVVGTPVQLMPYLDTPNNGGEYKAWLTPIGAYACALDEVSCGEGTFGFISSLSKVDNFKVRVKEWQEIDTTFTTRTGDVLDGVRTVWIDTLGASNVKWSLTDPSINVYHRAHVEAVEVGMHYIVLDNQPGCTIGHVVVNGELRKKFGPQTVPVRITQAMKSKGNFTVLVSVYCQ